VGTNVVIEFVQAPGTSEYRMTTDPAKDDLRLRGPGDPPATNADTPKAHASVQPMGPGAVLISVPLTAYRTYAVTVFGRVITKALIFSATPTPNPIQVFENTIQGPAPPVYTRVVRVPAGSYRLEIVVRETTTLKLAADTIEFEVK
jgi:hypothetical protein